MRDKIKAFFIGQFKQGASPTDLAKALAVGGTFAVFPILGTTTVLCLIVGYFWRLNQPTVQAMNYAMGPVQLIMIPIFIKMGAWLCGVPAVSVNPLTVVKSLTEAPEKFFADYGLAGMQALLAWLLLSPIIFGLLYGVSRQILGKVMARRTP